MENADNKTLTKTEEKWLKNLETYKDSFNKVMDDDFNTADGIAVIFDLIRK